jgi:hypothetical protein
MIEGSLSEVDDCLRPRSVACEGSRAFLDGAPKATLVHCLCHWATSIMGRFLWSPIMWMRFVQHLIATEPPVLVDITRTRVPASTWTSEEKSYLLCAWISPSDWLSPYCDWFVPRRDGIITLLTPYIPSKLVVKLFRVVSLWELVSLVSVAL